VSESEVIIKHLPQTKWIVLIVGVTIGFLIMGYLTFPKIIYGIYGKDSDYCRMRVPKAWLIEPVSVEEAEATNMYNGVPFGYSNEKWKNLKSQMAPIDTLWSFSSPDESWLALAGRKGYAVVRFGVPIDCIVTFMS